MTMIVNITPIIAKNPIGIAYCSYEVHVCEGRNVTGCLDQWGRNLADYPEIDCLTAPDQDECLMPVGGCPDDFVRMNSQNFTTTRCVPEDSDELRLEERRNEVYDPTRCAKGYELDVPKDVNIWRTGSSIGYCAKQQ